MNIGPGLEAFLHFAGLTERRCTACRAPFEPLPADGADESPLDVLAASCCDACRVRLPRRENGFCPYCGEPSPIEDAPCMPCASCLAKLPPWSDFLFFGIHEGLLRELLLRAKFSGSLAVLAMLGRLLAARCAEHYASALLPDAIVPVPLHASRLRERGFDQCAELAKAVGRRLGVPVEFALVKDAAGPAQSRLTREERRKMGQPFRCTGDVQGRRILLLDDICTTGTTLDRAAACLLAAGASHVDVAVLARTSAHAGPRPALP